MKKRRLLTAILISSTFAITAEAQTHEINVAEVINKTYNGYETNSDGGAITNSIASTIKDSIFTNNKALNYGAGGAIDINTSSDAVTEVINSTFDNNYSSYSGGAICQRRYSGPLNITGGSYTNNSAAYEGGALWLGNKSSIASSIDNVLFEGNSTESTNWADRFTTTDDGGGGAIFIGSAANVQISNSTFNKNISNTVGGAVALRNDSINDGRNSLSISNSEFSGNQAAIDGGAVASFIDFSLSNSTISDNTAGRNGGAIYIHTKSEGANGSNFDNLVISGNTADNQGGGIYSTAIGNVTVNNSTIDGNSAVNQGGGIFNTVSTMHVNNSIISNNTAEYGGGIFNNTGAELTIGENTLFTGNQAGRGGALYNYADGILTVEDNIIFSNNAATKAAGGAIQNFGSAKLGNNLVFENNKAVWG